MKLTNEQDNNNNNSGVDDDDFGDFEDGFSDEDLSSFV